MSRIGRIAIFTALKLLYEAKNYEGIGKVIQVILNEIDAENK